MIARQEITNLRQQLRLVQGRCDTCVHATAVSTTALPTLHNAPHSDSPDTSLPTPFSHKSNRQPVISRATRQIQSP